MTQIRSAASSLLVSRRRLLGAAAVGVAAPMILHRNAWAQDRTLQILTYTGPQGQYVREKVSPAFEAKFGCKVLQTEAATLANIATLRTQKNNQQISVAFMDDQGIPVAKAENLIAPLDPAAIPNLANVHKDYILRESHGVAFSISPVVPWFNKMAVSKPVESYADLWREDFAGRYMLVTPKFTNSVFLLILAASIVTGKSIHEAQYDIDAGWSKMEELKPNVQTIYDNVGAAILQVSQGQADVAGVDHTKGLYPYVDQGAPIEVVKPAEKAFAGVNCITIANNAPEPELANEFVNAMLSNEHQAALAESIFAAPSVLGLPLSDTLKERVPVDDRLSEMHIMDWDYLNPLRNGIIEKFNTTFGA